MRQAGLEPTTFGSGGGDGQRPPTLAVVVSGTYASRASASASQRRPRCYHRCYRGSLLRRCLGAATPCTCIRMSRGRSRRRAPRQAGYRDWSRAQMRKVRHPRSLSSHTNASSSSFAFCRSAVSRSEEHTSELQSRLHLVCRLLLEKKKKRYLTNT